MGNLGYDTSAEELIERAHKVMDSCRVDKAELDFVYCIRDPGSLVCLQFKTPAALQDCVRRIQAGRKTLADHGMAKPVWCSIEKNKAELHGNKVMHNCAMFVENVESTRPEAQRGVVTKNFQSRCVLVNKKMVARINEEGKCILSVFARNRWSPEECTEVITFTEL